MATIVLTRAPNTATLEAYREAYRHHARAIRAAAQPWPTIGVTAALLGISVFVYALFHKHFRTLSLLVGLFECVSGLAALIGAVRSWLYGLSHPVELPEPHTAVRWD
jgi:hypothetical protein